MHASRALTKNVRVFGSNAGGQKFVPPVMSGQVTDPVSLGVWPGNSIGRAGHPHARAADLPGIACPGLVARLARTWNGVEAPCALSCLSFVRVDEPSDAEFAAGHADDDFVLYDDGSDGRGITVLIVLHRHVPND